MTLLEKLGIDLTTDVGLAKAMNISCHEMPCYSECPGVYSNWRAINLCKTKRLFGEFQEIDWSKVPVDTKVLVWDDSPSSKDKRYFSHYENGIFYCFDYGQTSWNKIGYHGWSHCILAEPVKEEWLKK